MPDILPAAPVQVGHPRVLRGLERAAGALGRLDEALDNHPLLPAFLYRIRLEAVQRQAAVDGHGIDRWHLAATLAGLPLRMHDLDGFDRGIIVDAARAALTHHQWLVDPNFDQEGLVQEAEAFLAEEGSTASLLGLAVQTYAWLDAGGTRPPMRAALVRSWGRHRLLRAPVPITGPAALAASAPVDPTAWVAAFCEAVADEAQDYREILRQLDREWLAARRQVAGRRSTSHAGQAIDVLAAMSLTSATSLAGMLDLSIKSAIALLDGFVAQGIAIEVTHRSARRLFGLSGMAPVREAASGPRRPMPGRGRGRPRQDTMPAPDPVEVPLPPLPPMVRFERPPIDYAAIDAAMAHCDRVIRDTRLSLGQLGLPNRIAC